MREMDEKLGDIYGVICGKLIELSGKTRMIENCIPTEKEIEIVYDLAQRVLQYENVLVDASDVCGEIDRFVLAVCASRSANQKSQSSRSYAGSSLLQADKTTNG